MKGQKFMVRQRELEDAGKENHRDWFKLQSLIDDVKNDIMYLSRNFKMEETMFQNQEIDSAHITFRSMEGQARLINAYKSSCWSTLRDWLCCCCKRSPEAQREYDQKFFRREYHPGTNKKKTHGHWLKVEPAIQPSLIQWQNMNISGMSQNIRVFFLTFVQIVLIILTILALIEVKATFISDKDLFA